MTILTNLAIAKNKSDIPELPGIYAFFVDLIGPYSFGLRRGDSITSETWPKIASDIAQRFSSLCQLYRNEEYTGQLFQDGKSGLLRSAIGVKASSLIPTIDANEIATMSPVEAHAYLAVARKAQYFLPPVYVGVTYDQTLRDRYLQHQHSYKAQTEKNIFGKRFRDSGFVWEDLIFGYAELRAEELSTLPLRFLEAHIQTISPPTLSSR